MRIRCCASKRQLLPGKIAHPMVVTLSCCLLLLLLLQLPTNVYLATDRQSPEVISKQRSINKIKQQQQQQEEQLCQKPTCQVVEQKQQQQQHRQPGCKYLRGQWSSVCGADGLRVRVDKLISRVGQPATHSEAAKATGNNTCQLERRVTKDCKRVCHYVKSAWSDCLNGFKTRNLTLDTSNGWSTASSDKSTSVAQTPSSSSSSSTPTSSCARDKQVRRPCKARELTKQAISAKLTQRRRLKQLQQTSSSSSSSSSMLTTTKLPRKQTKLQTVRPPDANAQSDTAQSSRQNSAKTDPPRPSSSSSSSMQRQQQQQRRVNSEIRNKQLL